MNKYNIKVDCNTLITLFFENKFELNDKWNNEQSDILFKKIEKMDVKEIIEIIDNSTLPNSLYAYDIPQFGHIETIIKLVDKMEKNGGGKFSYTEIGFLLLENLNSKQNALTKYGETHSKGACMLGLAIMDTGKIAYSALTCGFNKINNNESKQVIIKKLLLRIKAVQVLIQEAKTNKVNGYSVMHNMALSTMKRRAICLKYIFKQLRTFGDAELNKRIANIYWEMEER